MDITRGNNSMGPFALKPLAEKRLILLQRAMLCTRFHNFCCTQLYPTDSVLAQLFPCGHTASEMTGILTKILKH